jgi:hypothetical protein
MKKHTKEVISTLYCFLLRKIFYWEITNVTSITTQNRTMVYSSFLLCGETLGEPHFIA